MEKSLSPTINQLIDGLVFLTLMPFPFPGAKPEEPYNPFKSHLLTRFYCPIKTVLIKRPTKRFFCVAFCSGPHEPRGKRHADY